VLPAAGHFFGVDEEVGANRRKGTYKTPRTRPSTPDGLCRARRARGEEDVGVENGWNLGIAPDAVAD
jgi:hypothetical protein